MTKTKYRLRKENGWIFSGFVIEKYVYVPDGPDDFNGLPTSLAGWKWVKCDEFDLPDIYAKLNANQR